MVASFDDPYLFDLWFANLAFAKITGTALDFVAPYIAAKVFPLWCIMGYYLAAPCHQRRLNAEGSRGVYLANPRQVWHENPAMQCVVYLCRVACCWWQQASECAQTISGGDQEPLLASSYAQESGRT